MKAYLIPGAILTLICAVLVFAITNWPSANTMSVDFPEKLNHRVVLNPASQNESSRIEYRKDDGTRVVAEVDYTNGVTSYLFYRPDGKAVAKVLDFYPEETPGQVERRLKGETYFSNDGTRLTKHVAYREDGTVERRGERFPDQSYHTVYIGLDGVTVEVDKIYDKDENLVSERGFAEDGSVKYRTDKQGYKLVTTTYRPDTTIYSIVENESSSQSGKFFQADGKTVKASFEKSTWRLQIVYNDSKGVPEYEVAYYDDRIEVLRLSPTGKVLYEQDLKLVGDRTSHCDGTYDFTQVTEYHMWGSARYQKSTKRIINFAADGKTPVEVIYPTNKSRKFTYSVDSNGIVTGVREEGNATGYGPGGAAQPAESYKVGDKIAIDPAMVSLNTFECLTIPEKLKVEAPPYYYYGGPF